VRREAAQNRARPSNSGGKRRIFSSQILVHCVNVQKQVLDILLSYFNTRPLADPVAVTHVPLPVLPTYCRVPRIVIVLVEEGAWVIQEDISDYFQA
jgi:hypothetical protein